MDSFNGEEAFWEAGKVVGKGFLNKFGEIFVERGDRTLSAGDGITAVRVMEPVQVAGGPLELAGGPIETRVVMTEPLRVDVLSLSTAIAVGAFGGWLIVKAAGAVSRFFSGGNGRDGLGPN